MDAKARFAKAINSLFKHSGVDGVYQPIGADKQSARMILRQPDPLVELGDRQLVVEQYRIDVRVVEWASPRRGDLLFVDNTPYSIEEEPRRDQHQLVWLLDVLPTKPVTHSGSRLRVR
jgi:hypothetical protein